MNPRRIRTEIALVLALSLGASAVYSVVSFLNSVTQSKSLGSQTTTLNPTLDSRWIFDLTYQLLALAFDLVPVALALYLLAPTFRAALRRIGLDGRRPGFDIGMGFVLFAAIGVPGIGLYLLAHAIGINTSVDTAGIGGAWYAVPVLVLSALRAALQEEVIVVGYLFERLRALAWRPWAIVAATALLRATYHLYQGWGGFIGNGVMGVVFGLVYLRWRRTGPLVVAHFLLDLVSFVGYAVVKALWPGLLP